MSSAIMASQGLSYFHESQYLEANEQGVFMKTAYRFPIPSAGQFHQKIIDLNTQNYYLKTIDAAPRYVCLYPGEHPQLASLLEDEWKGDSNVTSVITIFYTPVTDSKTPNALYFTVKEGNKTYRYYLVPPDNCEDSQCQLSIVRKDVTRCRFLGSSVPTLLK